MDTDDKTLERIKQLVREGKVSMPSYAADCFPMSDERIDEYIEPDFVHTGAIPIQDGFILRWGCRGIGFGEITFVQRTDGSWDIDDEMMGDRFVKKAIAHLCSGAS